MIVNVFNINFQASDSIKDQTLGDVDESLVDTGKFLQEFVSDSEKLKCLQIFAECLSMVNWIRKETKGKQFSIV